MSRTYVSTFCNFAHNTTTGRPVDHECHVLPVAMLEAERLGNYDHAIDILGTMGKGPVVWGGSREIEEERAEAMNRRAGRMGQPRAGGLVSQRPSRDLSPARKPRVPRAGMRRLSEIARDIRYHWKKVNFAAEPYLAAMGQLDGISDHFYEDSAKSIVAYFLANAGSFRGEEAKALKAELKAMLGARR